MASARDTSRVDGSAVGALRGGHGTRPGSPIKWAVISTNDQPDYLYCAPIVTWQWRRLGYEVLLLHHGDQPRSHPALAMTARLGGHLFDLPPGPWSGGDGATYCQVSRLLAATLTEIIQPDDMLTTSDVDMLVFREPPATAGAITSWGHDLTSFGHYPICYVSAQARDWLELFGLTAGDTLGSAMERFVARWPGYFAPETRWTIDQDALTACIDEWRRPGRGAYVGEDRTIEPESFLPLGRLDRFDWRYPAGPIIDCHLPRDPCGAEAHARLAELFARLGLSAETGWVDEYRSDFIAAGGPPCSAPRRSPVRNPFYEFDGWCNHRPLLYLALEATGGGDVLELGMGKGSTELLADYCRDRGRRLRSFEYNRDWWEKYRTLPHEVNLVRDWDDIHPIRASVALVDHSPGERRHVDIALMADSVDILVIHDSEPQATGYMLDRVWHLFRHRVDLKSEGAWATAVSNTIDVSAWDVGPFTSTGSHR
jgi:hypothetical protein